MSFSFPLNSSSAAPAPEAGYQRIVCLAPSLTKSLYELGAGDRIVGVTRFCPQEGSKKEIVGDLQSVNYEKLLSLKPDLVLAKDDCTRPEVLARMGSLGLNVKTFPEDRCFLDICEHFIELGQLLDMEAKATEIVDAVCDEAEKLSMTAGSRRPVRILWQAGSRPLVAAGKLSYLNDIAHLAGCSNIFYHVNKTFFIVNAEEVLKRKPDAIFCVSEENEGDPGSVWRRYRDLPAVKNGRIVRLDSNMFCQPTPGLFLASLRELVRITKPWKE